MRFWNCMVGIVAAGLMVSAVGTATAAVRPLKAGATSTTPTAASGEVGMLQQAYSILEKADHDYKGHRAAAMHSIAAACKELGSSEHGDGKGKEAQPQSDGQLKQAETLLQSALQAASGKPRVTKHIEHALKELQTALTIK